MPNSGKVKILSEDEIQRKLRRMSYEIHENCFHEKEVFLIGIRERGCQLVEHLLPHLKKISKAKIEVLEIGLDKKDPSKYAFTEGFDQKCLKGKTVILTDDVLNTGKTLMYAASALLLNHCRQLVTVVLVNRRHRLFPIRADIVGLTLSTTLKEHIEVELKKKDSAVYLK